MKVEAQPCFILHQRAWGETSLILDVFSLDYGRVSLVARGAKRGKTGQAGLLQPGRKLNLGWAIRTEMGTLVSVEAAGPAGLLSGPRLFSCFYLNELLIRMLHRHEAHPELFADYEMALMHLQQDRAEDQVLRIFEKSLLQSLGYGLILDHDVVHGVPIRDDRQYYYLIGSGPQEDPPGQPAVRIAGKTLHALESGTHWDEEVTREARMLMRTVLEGYIGDRPLASRALYRSYLHFTGGD